MAYRIPQCQILWIGGDSVAAIQQHQEENGVVEEVVDGPFCGGCDLHCFTMWKYFSCVADGDVEMGLLWSEQQDYSNTVLPMF